MLSFGTETQRKETTSKGTVINGEYLKVRTGWGVGMEWTSSGNLKKTVRNNHVSYNEGYFLSSKDTVSFSRALFNAVKYSVL
jgi:hypothetical protein